MTALFGLFASFRTLEAGSKLARGAVVLVVLVAALLTVRGVWNAHTERLLAQGRQEGRAACQADHASAALAEKDSADREQRHRRETLEGVTDDTEQELEQARREILRRRLPVVDVATGDAGRPECVSADWLRRVTGRDKAGASHDSAAE